MEHTTCPRCGRVSVRVEAASNGAEKSRCSTCGWEAGACFGRLHAPSNVKCAGGVDPTFWSDEGNRRRKCTYYEACQMMTAARQQIEVKGSLPVMGQGHLPQMPPASVPSLQAQTPVVPQVSAQKHPVLPPMPGIGSTTPTPVQQVPQYAQQQMQQVPLQQALQQRPQLPMQQPVQQQQVLQRPQQPVQQGQMQVYGGYYAGQPQQVPVYMVDPRHAVAPSAVPQNHVQPGAQMPSYLAVPEPYNGNFAPMFVSSLCRAGLKGMFSQAANLMDHIPWGAYPQQ